MLNKLHSLIIQRELEPIYANILRHVALDTQLFSIPTVSLNQKLYEVDLPMIIWQTVLINTHIISTHMMPFEKMHHHQALY